MSLLAALALLLCAPAWSQGVTAHTIVLGQSAPLSGPRQSAGERIRDGALAYLRRLNDAGGVHGRRIELATFDDGGDPARALANTRRLIEEFGVFALFGYPEADLTRDVLERVRRSGITLFGAECGDPAAHAPGWPVYTVCADRAQELERLVADYANLGQRRFALVRSDDAGGAALAATTRGALSAQGLGELRDAPYAAGASEVLARVLKAPAPDVILVALPQPPAAVVLRALHRSGSRAQLIATSLADARATARELGRDGAGIALSQTVPPLSQISLPVVSDYLAAYRVETGTEEYSPASLASFIAAKVLVEAMRRAGPTPTREGLAQALSGMGAYDAGGYVVHFSRTAREGSTRIYLQSIDREGGLLH
ncbi:MAG: ABC transporter substrate-binding protein [Burkholderiales bacterium]